MALSNDPEFAFNTNFRDFVKHHKVNPSTADNKPVRGNEQFAQDFKNTWLKNRFNNGRSISDPYANSSSSASGAPVTTAAADRPSTTARPGPGARPSAIHQGGAGQTGGTQTNTNITVHGNVGGGRRPGPKQDTRPPKPPEGSHAGATQSTDDTWRPGGGVNYNFGAHNALAHGPGAGFGIYDIEHMRRMGASEENIENYARDYQASGGQVGKIAAGIYGMQHNEGYAIQGADTSKGLGEWWTNSLKADRSDDYPIKDEYQQGRIEEGDQTFDEKSRKWGNTAGEITRRDMQTPSWQGQGFDANRWGYNTGDAPKWEDHADNVKNMVAGIDQSIYQDRGYWRSRSDTTRAGTFGDVWKFEPDKWKQPKAPDKVETTY